jgi:hypothetical protein
MADGVLEIRTYRLKPGSRDRFHTIFRDETLPLPRGHGVDVIGAGPSLADADHYVLVGRAVKAAVASAA